MRSTIVVAFLLLGSITYSQEVPDVYKNLGKNKKGVYLKKGRKKIYARKTEDKFKFRDLSGNPKGDESGIHLDFKYEELNGKLYFGFINYNDARYPQPVYFKRYVNINKGKAFIDIAGNFSGKYDMVGWEDTGKGTLGYRIVDENGKFIYDGKLSFRYENDHFSYVPTMIEGPFVDKVTPRSAVISFDITKPVKASVKVDGKNFSAEKKSRHHEIKVDGLSTNSKYDYTVKYLNRSYSFTFQTAPRPGSNKPFTFAYTSDSRAGQGGGERDISGSNAYIVKKIGALAREENAAFMQFSGDLINGYENSRERMNLQYANWKHAIEPFAHHFPVYEAFGNHEAYGYEFVDKRDDSYYMLDHFPFEANSGESVFQDNFVNPENGPQSEDGSEYDPNPDKQDFPSYEETVFWYQYANVAMVVLNSDYWYAPNNHEYTGGNIHAYIMDKQMEWLDRTLTKLEKDQTIDHIFVTLHTPFFPNGGHVGDDMWYDGDNQPRPVVGNQTYEKGIIERRDQLMDIIINQSEKTVAFLTGDEHNYNLLTIKPGMERYPKDYAHKKLPLDRKFYQINNGAAGAPYYAQEKTPWMQHVKGFSTQNALVLIDVQGASVKVRVKNPDTLEKFAEYVLRE